MCRQLSGEYWIEVKALCGWKCSNQACETGARSATGPERVLLVVPALDN